MHCFGINTNTIIVFKYISGYLILITHTISVLVKKDLTIPCNDFLAYFN